MRAAVLAIRAGVFDGRGSTAAVGDGALGASIELRTSHFDGIRLPWADADNSGPVVLVLAGHAGAGASTVALAIAEGLALNRSVQLVDYAPPAQSGLSVASSIELGADGAGWRQGRRGHLDVFRLARRAGREGLPRLPAADDAERASVVDVGWPLAVARLEAADGTSEQRLSYVVVTRVTVPALRQAEHALSALGGEPVVAAVGPARWPRMVEAGRGPLLSDLRSRGRVVRVPLDRRLAVTGLTGDRLPKPVASAGRALAALLAPRLPPAPRHRRQAAAPKGEQR
ncbi:hypothetical protein SAMN05660464_3769 [Geodermatophilus dictyosporus]|uniref:MinD-like ATPase involved in chromosome partitioning or flagellar assembly n=1 Tax=Geodermatophilus dictyosporus TaxID=1523247 RepID=A0A1I5RX70_9ACTN|nr:hypothetical protein [Geodermatophilus dictyosporus]SFP63149.1 hypothetical protein SAMN05660464_3769 [Geodermatophilus dictyosporus]